MLCSTQPDHPLHAASVKPPQDDINAELIRWTAETCRGWEFEGEASLQYTGRRLHDCCVSKTEVHLPYDGSQSSKAQRSSNARQRSLCADGSLCASRNPLEGGDEVCGLPICLRRMLSD